MVSPRVASLLLLALAATPGAADDFKWDPRERPLRASGSKFCEELSKTETLVRRYTDESGAHEDRREGREKIRLNHAVAAVDSAAVTEDKITVAEWSLQQGAERDDTLEGAVVTVKGEGAYRAANAQSERTLSRLASRWIEGHIVKGGKLEPTLDELDWDFILPKDPIADGGTWTIDPGAFAREVLGPRAEIDANRSKGTGKLTGVHVDKDVHFGRIEVSVSLALESLGAAKVTWTKGGVQEFHYVIDFSLEPRRRDVVAAVISMELKGSGTVTPEGATIPIELDETSRLEVRRTPLD